MLLAMFFLPDRSISQAIAFALVLMQEDRTSKFMNLQSEGCFGVYNMVTSSANRHGFMECTSGSERGSPHIILEMNLEDDMVR